jgi:protein-disulfide isomerase
MNDALIASAHGLGLDALMRALGIAPSQIKACLTHRPTQLLIGNMTKQAFDVQKILGTPNFLINGKPAIDTVQWAGIEQQLKMALGQR